MTAVLTIAVIAIAGFAWLCLTNVIPSCCTSLFRYRLWQLRDEVFDEIYVGTFDDSEQPERLVDLLEVAIAQSHEVTVFRLLLMRWSNRNLPQASRSDVYPFESLTEHDKPLMKQRLDRFESIIIRHVAFGSPSGWIAIAILAPMAGIAVIFDRLRGDRGGGSIVQDAKEDLRERLEGEPALAALMNGRKPKHSLSHCV